MNATVRTHSVAWIAVLGICCGAAGCSTTGVEKAELASQSLQALQADIQKSSQSLGTSVAALDDLVNKPKDDLKPQYDTFNQSMDALEAQITALKTRIEAMKARGREYFKAWEEQAKGISSPEMKTLTDERRATLEARYEEVKTNLQASVDNGKKLMDSLRDIRKYLGLDLTTNGLKVAAGPAAKAAESSKQMQADLEKLNSGLDKVAKTLSPSSAPPPPK